jgi:hypothetical protein
VLIKQPGDKDKSCQAKQYNSIIGQFAWKDKTRDSSPRVSLLFASAELRVQVERPVLGYIFLHGRDGRDPAARGLPPGNTSGADERLGVGDRAPEPPGELGDADVTR